MADKLFYSTKEVAEKLDYTQWYVCELIRQGKIPAVKMHDNGQYRVPASWVEERLSQKAGTR